MTVSVATIMNNEDIMSVVAVEAVKEVARVNGRTFKEAMTAYKLGVPNVVKNVNDLCLVSIKTLVEELN